MTIAWPLSRQQVLDLNGKPRLDLRASFYLAGTSTPRAVYADADLTTPLAQPVACDASGRFPRVFLGYGLYRERVSSLSAGLLWDDDGLGLLAPDTGTTTPGTEVPGAAIAQTGDVKWRMDSGIQPGWVRMNGGTIGNEASGASERGDADTVALFTYLWVSFSDSIAPVIGGRGSSAANDFASGKRITVPSMRGSAAVGSDTMGTTAAQKLQTIRTLTLTAGSSVATVNSADRLAPGMQIYATGISVGAKIVSISGTSITMTDEAAPGSSGPVSARFAMFDPQVPGGAGGDWLAGLSNANLPTTLPDGSTTYDPAPFTVSIFNELITLRYGDGGTGTATANIWQAIKPETKDLPSSDLTVKTANPTGGRPLATVQPVRIGTFYLKL